MKTFRMFLFIFCSLVGCSSEEISKTQVAPIPKTQITKERIAELIEELKTDRADLCINELVLAGKDAVDPLVNELKQYRTAYGSGGLTADEFMKQV